MGVCVWVCLPPEERRAKKYELITLSPVPTGGVGGSVWQPGVCVCTGTIYVLYAVVFALETAPGKESVIRAPHPTLVSVKSYKLRPFS